MKTATHMLIKAGALLVAATIFTPVTFGSLGAAHASEIRYVVNGQAVTTGDIQRRAAFLKLQQRKGNLNAVAQEEMVEQLLRLQEMRRQRISISTAQVDQAFETFAKSNKIGTAQLTQVLNQSGVGVDHFKTYIRAQMGWQQAVGARAQSEGTNAKDAIRQMTKPDGRKPSTTEYVLQQVIFVVPERERGKLMGKRKREAEQIRARFTSCETSRDLVKGMIDVTVRDLGRILEPELPPDWSKQVIAASTSKPTVVKETPRGIEFIGICSTRTATDDKVAQVLVQQEQAKSNENSAEALSKKYTKELRDKAQITNR